MSVYSDTTRTEPTLYADSFGTLVVEDPCPDPSYLGQEGFEERLRLFQRDGFGFVGVRAGCTIHLPQGDGVEILVRLESPGLWGIESDSGQEYLDEVGRDELKTLEGMLVALGVAVRRETPA